VKRVWLITRHEFLTTVKRPGYVFASFGLPLLMVGLMVGGLLLMKRKEDERIAQRSQAGVVDEGGFLTREPPSGLQRFADEPAAVAALVEGKITTYVLIKPDFLKEGRVEVKSKVRRTLLEQGTTGVPENVRAYLLDNVVAAVEDPDRRERIKKLLAVVRNVALDEQGRISTKPEPSWERAGVALGFVFALFMSINMAGSYLMYGLADEKENRVMEMVLTSVRPVELMWGKLLGLGGAGFLQLILWGVMGVSGVVAAAIQLVLDPKATLICLPLFVLGYLLVGSLMLGTGSLGTNLREVTQFSMTWSLLSAAPFFLLNPILADPNGPIARGLTYFPLTTASMLMLRYALDPAELPAWELAAGYGILIVSTVLAVRLAAKVYRVGVLLYGKRPTPRQVLRWIFR
jgi:ABC-2 type transport system permease protein